VTIPPGDFEKREFMVSREGGGSRFRAWPSVRPYPPFAKNTVKVLAFSEEEAIALVARGESGSDGPPQMGGEPQVPESDPIVALFYRLLRDHVVPGAMEQVMLDLEGVDPDGDGWLFSNQYLVGYGKNLAERLRKLDC
jgi:hypothetical protein